MTETFENKIRRLTEPFYYKFFLIPRARIRQYLCIRRSRIAGSARIVFIVSSLSMWRHQPLLDRIQKDHRFAVSVAIYPFPTMTKDQKDHSIVSLKKFFLNSGVDLIDLSRECFPGDTLRKKVNPDIIFYPQPYNHLFENDLDNQFFGDKLICYVPYGMPLVQTSWIDKNFLNNTAWRLFYHSKKRKEQAQKDLYNHGQNIRVTGDPISDYFNAATQSKNKTWKTQECPKKKVIWAPHFSITAQSLLHQNSFLWLFQPMIEISEHYKDCIQFSFKPHPRLFSVLSELPDWGRARAEAYYKAWEANDNTQLDTGEYIDLFKESDAMIHDCSSFAAEYHFTGKPVLFTSKKIESVFSDLNDFGKEALDAHYIADSVAGIIDFIENTVLGGEDPKKPERESFFLKNLCPPDGYSASENIYNEILKGLGFEQ